MNTTPCDPKATREARVLLQYLASIITGVSPLSIKLDESDNAEREY